MIRINLLPHREAKRAEKQREFGLMSLLVAVLAAAIVFVGWTYLSAKKKTQLERNTRLEQAIAKLDVEIADISKLKDQISNVVERKQIVENLQINRNQAVVLLDEIARQMPQGVYLKSIVQKRNVITIKGDADTSARIATEVRNLGASAWLEKPVIVEIKTTTSNNIQHNNFTMQVNLKSKKSNAMREEAKPKGVKP